MLSYASSCATRIGTSKRTTARDVADARDGYGATGRLFALGYLKGLLQGQGI